MTLTPITCEARIMGFSKQSRADGDWTELRIHIHPDETPHSLFLLPLKTHVMLSIKGTEEEPITAPDVPEKPAETERPSTADWSEAKRKMVQRAALVCKEPGFQRWVISLYPTKGLTLSEDTAKQHVYYFCDVKSRADIDPEKISGGYFKTLMLKYEAARHGETDEDMATQLAGGPS